jgi:hypothetical protein
VAADTTDLTPPSTVLLVLSLQYSLEIALFIARLRCAALSIVMPDHVSFQWHLDQRTRKLVLIEEEPVTDAELNLRRLSLFIGGLRPLIFR